MDFSIKNHNLKQPVIKKIEKTTEIEPINDKKEKESDRRKKEETEEKKQKTTEEMEDELGNVINVKW